MIVLYSVLSVPRGIRNVVDLVGRGKMANEGCQSRDTSGDRIRGESAVDSVPSTVWQKETIPGGCVYAGVPCCSLR